jgi:hypothetical protein
VTSIVANDGALALAAVLHVLPERRSQHVYWLAGGGSLGLEAEVGCALFSPSSPAPQAAGVRLSALAAWDVEASVAVAMVAAAVVVVRRALLLLLLRGLEDLDDIARLVAVAVVSRRPTLSAL